MDAKKMLVLVVLSITLALSACGSTKPKAGNWRGENISFTVTADNKIMNFEFVCSKSDEFQLTNPLTASQLDIKDDGTFAVGDPSIPLVRGKFTSSTKVSGDYENLSIYCGRSEKTWEAQWVEP